MDGEAGCWSTGGNIGLPPLARVMGVGRQQHNLNSVNFMTINFYVDDGLCNTESEEEAIKLIRDARDICNKGNLRLHKFVSN